MNDSFDVEQLHQFFTDEDELRLFKVGVQDYVQYLQNKPFPDKIYQYMLKNQGNRPPYLQLPDTPTEFDLSQTNFKLTQVIWAGQGELSDEILDFICENGTLPPRVSNS